MFFWKKKHFFIIIPLITAILCAGIVYLIKHDSNIQVEKTVFIGSVNKEELKDKKHIEFDYKKHNDSLEVNVPRNDYVQFVLTGKDKDKLIKDLDLITSKYYEALNINVQNRFDATNVYLDKLEKQSEGLNKLLKEYKQDLLSFEGTSLEYEALAQLINEQENTYNEAIEIEHRKRGDLEFFEMPKEFGVEIQKPKTYWKESSIVGALIGFVLTIGLLILMKYIENARRNYKHD